MTTDAAATRTWETISQRLREALNPSTYDTWFGGTEALEASPERLVVGVPNEFTKTWIEGHFGSLLNAAAAEYELTVELRVAVSEAVRAAAAEPDPEPETVRPQPPVPAQVGVLNPRYTFDLFVIGPSNRFAHAAALAVAEAPAQAFNPLFIYGSTGLGKTHLLQAVAQYVMQQHPYLTVRYVTTETVLNEFVDALRDKSMVGFKGRYRSCDVLLIDDIQFIEGKNSSRRSFSTPSTACTRPGSRSSSRRTGNPESSRRSRPGCARGSSGGSSPTCSRPTSRRASRSCARRS